MDPKWTQSGNVSQGGNSSLSNFVNIMSDCHDIQRIKQFAVLIDTECFVNDNPKS